MPPPALVYLRAVLSVLLPVRDGAATLDAALASLQRQTIRPARVFVVDDGSTDGTAERLVDWARRWPAISPRRVPASGIGRALNVGLARAREEGSRWIARMDADDVCDPRRFEVQLALAEREPRLSLVGCEVRHVGDGAAGMRAHVDWANRLHSHPELALGLWIDSPLPHPGWLVRRDAFDRVGEYDDSGRGPEDYDWLHRFFAAGLRAGKPRGPLVEWNDSPRRLTRTAAAYSEAAFAATKARALPAFLGPRAGARYFVGLGRRGKIHFPFLEAAIGGFDAIVDVSPSRIGQRYRGLPIRSVDEWREAIHGRESLTLSCLGTVESRDRCERLFAGAGLVAGENCLAL